MLILVYAGANGTGKSTLFTFLKEELDLPFINSDMIAKDYFGHITDEEERYRQHAMPFAEKLKKELMKHGKDFSFETVLSHSSKIEYLYDAKKQGYEIYSIFIGTDDPAINIIRVQNRVSNGGHNVPEEKIIDRYYRTMDNLPELLNLSEEAVILDNSKNRPIEVFYKSEGKYYLLKRNVPNWVNQYILKPLKEKGYLIEYPRYLYVLSEGSLIKFVKHAALRLPKHNISTSKPKIAKLEHEISETQTKKQKKIIEGKVPLKKQEDEQEE